MIDDLLRDGVAVAPDYDVSPAKATELVEHLKDSWCSDDHVFGRDLGQRKDYANRIWGNPDWPIIGFQKPDVITAPNYLPWALKGVAVAEHYFGEEALLYCTSAFVTQPSHRWYRDTHDWHRDRENPCMLVMFMYATNVPTPDAGAHLYEVGSHRDADKGENYNGYQPRRPIRTITGPAGTTFFMDPRGIHMGIRPTAAPRALVWARYCAASCRDGAQDTVPRALIECHWPTTEREQRALAAIVEN